MKHDIFQSMREQMVPNDVVLEDLAYKLSAQQVATKPASKKPFRLARNLSFMGALALLVFVFTNHSASPINGPAISPETGEQGEALDVALVPLGGFVAEYAIYEMELDPGTRGERLMETEEQMVYALADRDDLVYVYIEQGGAWYMGRFLTVQNGFDTYVLGDVLTLVYNVHDVDDVISIHFGSSDRNNTAVGQREQEQVPSISITDRESLQLLYGQLVELEMIHTHTWLDQSDAHWETWTSQWNEPWLTLGFEASDMVPDGLLARVSRTVTLQLESGVEIEFEFNPIERRLFQGGFSSVYQPLDEEFIQWLIELAHIDMNLEMGSLPEVPEFDALFDVTLPDYFGGVYVSPTNELVIQLTEVTDENVATFVTLLGHDQFIVEEVQYSQQQLDAIMDEIARNVSPNQPVSAYAWYVDTINNRVIVELVNYNQQQIDLFRELVSDSTAIVFSQGTEISVDVLD